MSITTSHLKEYASLVRHYSGYSHFKDWTWTLFVAGSVSPTSTSLTAATATGSWKKAFRITSAASSSWGRLQPTPTPSQLSGSRPSSTWWSSGWRCSSLSAKVNRTAKTFWETFYTIVIKIVFCFFFYFNWCSIDQVPVRSRLNVKHPTAELEFYIHLIRMYGKTSWLT